MRPIILDLFCGEGGAAMGYYHAGFNVIGVDHAFQDRYPFGFIRMDAFEALKRIRPDRFAAIHASPPCQEYSETQRINGYVYPDLIDPLRRELLRTGLPYVLENVEGARRHMKQPTMLCGAMFGLRVYRHRLFETNFELRAPWHPKHWLKQNEMGERPQWDEMMRVIGSFRPVDEGREAMEMPWASRDGMAEAIPPRYTEHVGGYLLAHLGLHWTRAKDAKRGTIRDRVNVEASFS